MFEFLSKKLAKLESEHTQEELIQLAQALEDNLDVCRAIYEACEEPFLIFLPAGTTLEEYKQSKSELYRGTNVIGPSIISEKLTKPELWEEFEKRTES
jgi:hypothetical protein